MHVFRLALHHGETLHREDIMTTSCTFATRGLFLSAVPYCVSVSHKGGPVVPTPDDIAERGTLRGLGQELVRVDIEITPVGPLALQRHWSWYHSGPLTKFLRAVDNDLRERLTPHVDPVQLEACGEQVLDLLIRRASEEVWTEWLRASLGMVASVGRTDIFSKLFACHGNSLEGWSARSVNALLTKAATGGSIEVVSALLAADGVVPLVREVDEVDRPMTAIFTAARCGHRSVVAALLDAGAPVEYKDKRGGTILTTAVENGHDEVVLELLAAGADVNNSNDQRAAIARSNITTMFPGFTTLCIATAKNNKGLVDILLAAGAHLGEHHAKTIPLHLAAEWGYVGPLESLLAAGADVNLIDSGGRSALQMACVKPNRRSFGSFLSGCRPLKPDATVCIRNGEAVERLLKAGAEVHHVDSVRRSALHIACWYNQERAVELLLRFGARPNLVSHEGHAPADLVGLAALELRETGLPRLRRQHPATLNAEETYVTDKISASLRAACAWGRRGWLVIMRARYQPKDHPAHLTSSSPQLPSMEPRRLRQTMESQQQGYQEDVGEDDLALSAAPRKVSTNAPPSRATTVFSALDDQECSGARAPDLGGGDRGDGACASAGWEEAVQWLVQCSDEHGAFRGVLSFI